MTGLRVFRAPRRVGHLSFSAYLRCAGVSDPPEALQAAIARRQAESAGRSVTCIQLTWEPPAKDNGSHVTGYVVEHDGGDGFIPVYRGPHLHYGIDAVAAASFHRFRVCAINAAGSSAPSPAVAVEAPPEVLRLPLWGF